MYKRLISTALIFGVAALAPPAFAQPRPACFVRDILVDSLQERFNESLTGDGLQNPGQLLEIWTSHSTGSFTIFITHPNGTSCVVASGYNWHTSPLPAQGLDG